MRALFTARALGLRYLLIPILTCSLLLVGCDSDNSPSATVSLAQPLAGGVLSQRQLLHESELAQNSALRANLKGTVVLSGMESAPVGTGDLTSAGVDEIPYLLQVADRLKFKLETTSVREAALFSGHNRLFTLKVGEEYEIWLPPGEYRLRLTSAGGPEEVVATGFIDSQASAGVTAQSTTSTFRAPGIYIASLPDFGTTLTGVDFGVTAIVGAAPGPQTAAIVNSVAELPDSFFQDVEPPLKRAVEEYFANGGETLQVVRVPSATPSALVAGLGLVTDDAKIVVLPDLADLSQSDTEQVLDALKNFTDSHESLALLDMPSAITQPSQAQSWLQARPQYQIDRFCFFWPSISESGQTVAISPGIAGLFAKGVAESGVAGLATGYFNPLANLTSLPYQLNVEEMSMLGAAGINSMLIFNQQVVCLGDRTGSSDLHIRQRRAADYLEASIEKGLQSFAYAPNEATTWNTANRVVSSFLANFWNSGGLDGNTVSEAFSVSCGLNTTMTPQDVLDGTMIMEVSFYLVPAKFVSLTLEQSVTPEN